MNALTSALRILGQHKPALPSWAEYEASDAATRREIEIRWCDVAHRGFGCDPSQAKEAMSLYCRAISLRGIKRKVRVSLDDTGHDERAEHLEREQDYIELGGMK